MHWQKAAGLSKERLAERVVYSRGTKRLFVMDLCGHAVEVKQDGTREEARQEDVRGFLDWEPVRIGAWYAVGRCVKGLD